MRTNVVCCFCCHHPVYLGLKHVFDVKGFNIRFSYFSVIPKYIQTSFDADVTRHIAVNAPLKAENIQCNLHFLLILVIPDIFEASLAQ